MASSPSSPSYPRHTLPLENGLPWYNSYPNGHWPRQAGFGEESGMLQTREVFMMALMDQLTDKQDWDRKVFDPRIVAKWRAEAVSHDEDGFYHMITEDRKTNADSRKPRTRMITEEVFDYCVEELKIKAAYLKETGLVHTLDSCGRTVVKSDVAVDTELRRRVRQAFDRLKADQASSVDWHPRSDEMVQDLVHPSMYPLVYGRSSFFSEEVVGVTDAVRDWAGTGEVIGSFLTPPADDDSYYLSKQYQWLPANMNFDADGSPRFTSYINNLHPERYPEIYSTIEKLVEVAIPAWNQCLSRRRGDDMIAAGRPTARIGQPDIHLLNDEKAWEPAKRKWLRVRDPKLPLPDSPPYWDYTPKERIQDLFRNTGLQVIVKIASIELTPEKPDFPAGSWHLEGMLNERICATALYYLDSENVTDSSLSFRLQTGDDLNDKYGSVDREHGPAWLQRVYDAQIRNDSDACIQNLGSVNTRPGRLLAFQNSFQHRASPFSLEDRTKPGHRRFIALWLVDPFWRVVSTANVPPQQLDWWAEAAFGARAHGNRGTMPSEMFDLLMQKYPALAEQQRDGAGPDGAGDACAERTPHLPRELWDQVEMELATAHKGLMSAEEAREHRLRLMDERSRVHKETDDAWTRGGYNFCEH